MADPDLGSLKWDEALEAWQGFITLSSDTPFDLLVFARESRTPDRQITPEARRAVELLRNREASCRRYAAEQLVQIYNAEWAERDVLAPPDLARQLVPDSVEVHETGYAEVHFQDGGLFAGHGVGVRVRPDGTFQEAVLEG